MVRVSDSFSFSGWSCLSALFYLGWVDIGASYPPPLLTFPLYMWVGSKVRSTQLSYGFFFPLSISGLDISQIICPKFCFILQQSNWKLSDELEYWATASVFNVGHKWCCLLFGILDSEHMRPAGLILSSLVVSSGPFPLRQLRDRQFFWCKGLYMAYLFFLFLAPSRIW